ncbi:MAG: 50S ribosomal protein L9 [Clostridia bacterium]|jgi:large subunit ribosomal protein L9|nr:50S ribosomal protein L9 [Clostridia bacterium]MCL6521852.1 50S ribosomal protein L9 [Bacillota bacterium]
MKVILRQEVAGLGTAGDLVEVKPGYARNYLLPRGLAVEASSGALRQLEEARERIRRQAERELERARKIQEAADGSEVTLAVRVGKNGKLFGSVTAADIAAALEQQRGVRVDRRQVRLAEPIKSAGDYAVELRVHPQVSASVRVRVVPEGAEVGS